MQQEPAFTAVRILLRLWPISLTCNIKCAIQNMFLIEMATINFLKIFLGVIVLSAFFFLIFPLK